MRGAKSSTVEPRRAPAASQLFCSEDLAQLLYGWSGAGTMRSISQSINVMILSDFVDLAPSTVSSPRPAVGVGGHAYKNKQGVNRKALV